MCRTAHQKKKLPFESNPIPYPVYLYLSMSVFLVSLTAPNNQFSKAGSKLLKLDSRSKTMCMLTIFP